MRKTVDVFIPCEKTELAEALICQLEKSTALRRVTLLVKDEPKECRWNTLKIEGGITSSETLRQIGERASADYVLLQTKMVMVTLGAGALERMAQAASAADASLLYADHYEQKMVDGKMTTERHPAIDYQLGSIRDDFDFGSLLLMKTSLLSKWAVQRKENSYAFAGLYDLRLFLSREGRCSI